MCFECVEEFLFFVLFGGVGFVGVYVGVYDGEWMVVDEEVGFDLLFFGVEVFWFEVGMGGECGCVVCDCDICLVFCCGFVVDEGLVGECGFDVFVLFVDFL